MLRGARLWAAVAGLSLDQLVAWGVLYYAYTILSVPIAADLGVSRLHVAAAFSLCLLVAGFLGQHVGAVLDTRGTRGSLRLGAVLAPLVFAALGLVSHVASLVAAFALLGAVQALALYEPAFRTIVDWCPEERARARAMLALTIVGGFASTVFLPLTGWLLAQHGWRGTVFILAALLAVVLVPTRFLLPLSQRGDARATVARLHAPPSARRLATGLALHSLASTGVFVYLVWHLVERGASLGAAATLAGLAGGAQGLGRLLSGPLRRVAGGANFLSLLLATQAAALLGVVALEGMAMTGCVLLFGAASGVMTLERATILLEWYGRATFGAHQGRLAAATSTARALSPFLVEAAHRFASYAVVFSVLGVVLVLSAWLCRVAARLHHGEQLARSEWDRAPSWQAASRQREA